MRIVIEGVVSAITSDMIEVTASEREYIRQFVPGMSYAVITTGWGELKIPIVGEFEQKVHEMLQHGRRITVTLEEA